MNIREISREEVVRLQQCEQQSVVRGNRVIDLERRVVNLEIVIEKLREAIASSAVEAMQYAQEIEHLKLQAYASDRRRDVTRDTRKEQADGE